MRKKGVAVVISKGKFKLFPVQRRTTRPASADFRVCVCVFFFNEFHASRVPPLVSSSYSRASACVAHLETTVLKKSRAVVAASAGSSYPSPFLRCLNGPSLARGASIRSISCSGLFVFLTSL